MIRRYLSGDLRRYSRPSTLGSFLSPADSSNLTNAAIAKDNRSGVYLLMTFSVIPDDAMNRSKASTYSSADGLHWTALKEGVYLASSDCAHTGLLSHPTLGWSVFHAVN